MNFIVIAIGIFAFFSGLAFVANAKVRKMRYERKVIRGEFDNETAKPAPKSTKGVIIAIVGAIIILVGCSFTIVPTGYTGVRTTFGQVSERVVNQGPNAKIPFIQNIILINNKQQDAVVESQVWGETKEKTPVYASSIIITYQIDGSKSAWLCANVTNYKNLIDANIVSSAIKSAMVELDAAEVTNRQKIEPAVKKKLNTSLEGKYGENTVEIIKVIIDNMDFEASYNEAIAAKSIAQQTQEKQKIENETAVAKAITDKQVAVTTAEGRARAELILAEAESKANELRTESLTDGILKAKFYEKWDGKLPAVMGGNGTIVDIGDMISSNVPNAGEGKN